MNKLKATAVFLAFVMCLGLTACGSSSDESSSAPAETTAAADNSAEDNTAEGGTPESEAETEPETEVETEPDPYEGMVKLDLGEGYDGYNAYFYVPEGSYSETYSNYDNGASLHYKNDELSYEIWTNLKLVKSKSHLTSTGYEAFDGNDNSYEASINNYDADHAQAGYYFYTDGLDGTFVELQVKISSLYDMDEATINEIIESIGKSATIEGDYVDTASGGNDVAEDGALTSDEGYLTFPAEITIKGETVKLEKELNTVMRIKGVTPEIDGETYTIKELGTVTSANYDGLLDGTYVSDKKGAETTIAGYTTARLVYVNSGYLKALYFVKVNDDTILDIEINNSKIDFAGANTKVNDETDTTNAFFDELASDFLGAATVNVE